MERLEVESARRQLFDKSGQKVKVSCWKLQREKLEVESESFFDRLFIVKIWRLKFAVLLIFSTGQDYQVVGGWKLFDKAG